MTTGDDRQGDRPLHPLSALVLGGWWACQHPERPPKPNLTAFDPGCADCSEVLAKVLRLAGEQVGRQALTMSTRTRSGIVLPGVEKASTRLARARRRGR